MSKIFDILTRIAEIAENIVDTAESTEETLPPHREYIVEGELIRELVKALNDLQEEEDN